MQNSNLKTAIAVKGYYEEADNKVFAIISNNPEIKMVRMSIIPLELCDESQGMDVLLDIMNELKNKFDYNTNYEFLKSGEFESDLKKITENSKVIKELFG